MLWGVESNVIERFSNAGVKKENISFIKDVFTFNSSYSPAELVGMFRDYYGPTMNAFEAAEKNGKSSDLQRDLVELFTSQNKSHQNGITSISANFLRVTVLR
jgi:hypothetical protein